MSILLQIEKKNLLLPSFFIQKAISCSIIPLYATFSRVCKLLLKVQPPADRSHAQMKMVLTHRARRGKNAEAFLNSNEKKKGTRTTS